MRQVTITLVYDTSDRMRPDKQPLGKALQDLYFAAHNHAGIEFGVARAHWKEEHSDVATGRPQEP